MSLLEYLPYTMGGMDIDWPAVIWILVAAALVYGLSGLLPAAKEIEDKDKDRSNVD